MRLSIFSRLFPLVLFFFPGPLFAEVFQPYTQEVLAARHTQDCSTEELIPATEILGAVYICTFGSEKTAKWFVSEQPQTGKVLSIGLIWVDWQIDTGYGIRADWQEVERVLDALIARYVPSRGNDLRKAFWDSENANFTTSNFVIYYVCKPSSDKEERIIVIQEK